MPLRQLVVLEVNEPQTEEFNSNVEQIIIGEPTNQSGNIGVIMWNYLLPSLQVTPSNSSTRIKLHYGTLKCKKYYNQSWAFPTALF